MGDISSSTKRLWRHPDFVFNHSLLFFSLPLSKSKQDGVWFRVTNEEPKTRMWKVKMSHRLALHLFELPKIERATPLVLSWKKSKSKLDKARFYLKFDQKLTILLSPVFRITFLEFENGLHLQELALVKSIKPFFKKCLHTIVYNFWE